VVALAGGGCTWLALWLAAPSVHSGTTPGVLLATLVLTPLAAFEAVSGLPAAAEQGGTARAGLRRIFALLDAPAPVPVTRSGPPPPGGLRAEGVTARWPGADRDAVSAVDFALPPGHRLALVGPSGAGKSTVAALLVRFLDPVAGRITLAGSTCVTSTGTRCGPGSPCWTATPTCSTPPSRRTCGSPGPTRRWPSYGRHCGPRGSLIGWTACRPDCPLRSVRAASWSPVASAAAWPWPAVLLREAEILVLDEPTEHLDGATAAAITADLLAATAGAHGRAHHPPVVRLSDVDNRRPVP